MSQQHFTTPTSILARKKDGEAPKKQTREGYRQQKELEELRKAGSAPAEVDEEGKDINPHIPKYITDVPWYATDNHAKPTLKHQRIHPEKSKEYDTLNEWHARGHVNKVATRYRPNACENCGAMTHKRKDCVGRPRGTSARFTGTNFAPDEYVQPNINLSYDGKRDRWNGVDINLHQQKNRDDHNHSAEAKKVLKAKKLDEESIAKEQTNAETTYIDSKQRIGLRTSRTREDIPKYLLNLDPNSAHYDPKSHSMRGNPFSGTNKDLSQVSYSGDNFVRYSGEAKDFAKSQIFALEASEKGVSIHQQADPTKLELLNKEFHEKKNQIIKTDQQQLIERYGGEEHLNSIPYELVVEVQTEQYVEFNRFRKIIQGDQCATIKSKYVEDVHENDQDKLNKQKFQPKSATSAVNKNSLMKKLDKKKVQEAPRNTAKHERQAEEELEVYRLKRHRYDDPMASQTVTDTVKKDHHRP